MKAAAAPSSGGSGGSEGVPGVGAAPCLCLAARRFEGLALRGGPGVGLAAALKEAALPLGLAGGLGEALPTMRSCCRRDLAWARFEPAQQPGAGMRARVHPSQCAAMPVQAVAASPSVATASTLSCSRACGWRRGKGGILARRYAGSCVGTPQAHAT